VKALRTSPSTAKKKKKAKVFITKIPLPYSTAFRKITSLEYFMGNAFNKLHPFPFFLTFKMENIRCT
jgi:hypothetical protein